MMSTVERPSLDERIQRARSVQQQQLRHAGRPRLQVTVSLPVLDVHDFNDRIIRGYEEGYGEKELPADLSVARSLIPAGTATLRDFSYIAPEIPEYIRENCTGCMDCVTQCPDTAILGKVIAESDLEAKLQTIDERGRPRDVRAAVVEDPQVLRRPARRRASKAGLFAIIIDPSKCKGCAECVTVCDDLALKMIPKTEPVMESIRKSHRYFKNFGPCDNRYINDNLLIDMMLKEQTHIYVGGAGSCAGCGEGTALRMMCAATGAEVRRPVGHRRRHRLQHGLHLDVSVQPVPRAVDQLAVRERPGRRDGRPQSRWDQMGWHDRPLWCIGGDGAMFDIGFQSLRRMLASGMNIKVFVLDTQVYSNTGGQASTSTYIGQNTKMSVHGKAIAGKQERRKEIAQIAMMHPRTFVAQTTCAHANHFYKSVLGALEFDGPAIVCCYTTCQPEHGVADNMASNQARLAVDTRAFPLLIYDPRKGDTIKERLSLQGNPAVKDDWCTNPKTGETGRLHRLLPAAKGRFAKHFDKEGNPSRDAAGGPARIGWRTGDCCRSWPGCGSVGSNRPLANSLWRLGLGGRNFPQAERLVLAAGGQRGAVGRERGGQHARLVGCVQALALARGDVPQRHGSVPVRGGQPPPVSREGNAQQVARRGAGFAGKRFQ